MKVFDETKYTKWYITKTGKVISRTTYNKNRESELLPNKNKRGYLYARTTNGNYQIHRLVAKAYIPNPDNKPCINHKDFDRHNNDINNLEWVTHKGNTRHSRDRMTYYKKNEGSNVKYSNEICRKVLDLVRKGQTYKNAGAKYNMPYSTVAHLVRGSRREV